MSQQCPSSPCSLIFPPEGVAQSTLDGEWVVTINSPLGPFEFPVTIVQEGDELTVSTPPSPEGEPTFMGRVDGSSVRFEFDIDYVRSRTPHHSDRKNYERADGGAGELWRFGCGGLERG